MRTDPIVTIMMFWPIAESLRRHSLEITATALVYTALAVMATGGSVVQSELLPATVLLGSLLAVLGLIDRAVLRLPDPLTAALAMTGLSVCFIQAPDRIGAHLAGMVAGFAALALVAKAYHHWSGIHGLGLGDAKLLGAAGAWVGIEGLATVVLWASLAALVAAVIARALGYPISLRTRLAFGPFLALATWLVWLFGPIG